MESNIDKIGVILSVVEEMSEQIKEPLVLVIEAGHLTLPYKHSMDSWVCQNLNFTEKMIKSLISRYKKRFRVLPIVLINDLGYEHCNEIDINSIFKSILKDNVFITTKSIKIISERNMRNRATESLKNDDNNIEAFSTRAFLKNETCNYLPIANINKKGRLIPRCGGIMNSFVERAIKLGCNRFPFSNPHVIFCSFAESEHEYYQTQFGIDIYRQYNETEKNAFLLAHWQPDNLHLLESLGFNKQEWLKNENN